MIKALGIAVAMVVVPLANVQAQRVLNTCTGTLVLQQLKTDPLIGAAGSGDLARVKRLLQLGHDVNFQECNDWPEHEEIRTDWGWTPLMVAAMHGHLAVITYLVKEGARLETSTSTGATALTLAAYAERCEAVALLKQLGAKSPPDGVGADIVAKHCP